RVWELFRLFGQTVLGVELAPDCDGYTFDLRRLTEPFSPLPDGPDMEMIRVKALHFRYPERLGRRQVKLETLTSDEPLAIQELIKTHFGPGELLQQVTVSHAELQVKLRMESGSKSHVIRLW